MSDRSGSEKKAAEAMPEFNAKWGLASERGSPEGENQGRGRSKPKRVGCGKGGEGNKK